MADNEGGAATLPDALGKRDRTITLTDGTGRTIQVSQWAWRKGIQVYKQLTAILNKIPEDQYKDLRGKKAMKMVAAAMEILGDDLIPLLQISVASADKDKVTDELLIEDVMSLMEAIFELNLTEGLVKKVKGLWRKYVPKVEEKSEKSDSSTPSGSSAQQD